MTRRDKRRQLTRWLSAFFTSPFARHSDARSSKLATGRTILVEPLESRQLLASDGFMALLGSSYADSGSNSAPMPSSLQGEGELVAEGEDAPDLVAFAKALADSGTRFFGAAWCPFCNEQKALFQDGAKYLPYIEVTNPDRTPNQIANDEGITQYPTWEFPGGERLVGVQTLATLAAEAGITIPQSSTPSFAELPNVNVQIGSPLHVPVDAYDPNGNPLTITVTSSNPSVLTAEVLDGNRSVTFATNYGDMTFELFEDRAPVPAGRVIELANDGFYDGIIFHRVINNFVIQGGDPTGTGSGGSTLGDFDDQFHLDLQHNRTGVLSFAKSTDDTNDSQFFITEGPQRFLDFNHSVFGQLVEGELNREAISNTATNSSDRPTNDVVINTATVFSDTENGVIMLKAAGNTTGTSTITVTVSDNEGNSTSQSFTATVVQDTANGAPFLNPIPDVQTAQNTPVTINLSSQDAEGDTVVYSVQAVGTTTYGLTVNSSTGVVTVTPPNNFSGELQFRATVQQTTTPTTSSATDTQLVTVLVDGATTPTPTGLDLVASSDSGASSTDNITNAQSLTFNVSGTISGATVEVVSGGNVVGTAVASGSSTEVVVSNVTSLGQGSVLFTARQRIGTAVSAASTGLAVVLDRQAPASLGAVFPSEVRVGETLTLDLSHSEEGAGLVYGLSGAPAGMTIAAQTGQVAWTPTSAQVGNRSFSVTLTDAAGNISTQEINLNVLEASLMRISLATVDLSGAPITTIAVGQTFRVQLIVQDLREGAAATGVFSAFADLEYNSSVLQPIATNPISHPSPYSEGVSGTITAGLVNELGAISDRTSRLGNEPRVLAEVTFQATAAGNANLSLNAPDEPTSDLTLYDEAEKLPLTSVEFGSSDFAVGVDFQLVADSFNFDEDSGTQQLNVLSNDTTTGGATLTIVEVGTLSNGTVTIASNGQSLNYTPAANFNGAESFTYTVANQNGLRQTTTVTVQLTDVNDPPVALNDTFSVVENSTQNVLEVLANDNSGVDSSVNETLTVTSVGAGSAGGTIVVGSSGLTVRYTPVTGFSGTETFTYTISDGRGGTATATASVSVSANNPPPTAVADSFTVVEDAAQATFDVLANDSTDDETETISIASVQTSQLGSQFSVSPDGLRVLYRPAANLSGREVLNYVLRDSGGATAVGTVTFNITAVNDPPNAVDDTLTALSSTASSTLNVLANDENPDTGETLTITAVSQPPTGNGTISITNGGQSLTYVPPSSGFEGSFAFTYTIGDGSGLTDTATVNLSVNNFTPRSIGGNLLYYDSLATGFFQLPITLRGTDFAGNQVERSTRATNGIFNFDNLAPGEYNLERAALPFLNDNGASIALVSAASDGNMTQDLNIQGSLRPEFFDVRDFLGSTMQNSLTVALNDDGTESWIAARGDWSQLSSVDVSVDSATNALRINALNASQAAVNTSQPINGTLVSRIAQQDSTTLLRVRGSTTRAALVAPPAAGGGSSTTTASATSNNNGSSTNLAGEGEGVATPAVGSSSTALSGPESSQVSTRPVEESNPNVIPRSALQRLLGSSSRVRATSADSVQATDAAMASVLPTMQLRLASDLESVLTSSNEENEAITDSAIAGL